MDHRTFLGLVGVAGAALAGFVGPASGRGTTGSEGIEGGERTAAARTGTQSYAEILAGGSGRW